MSYITQSDIETKLLPEELLQLTDRDGDGVADDNAADIIAQAIADGTGKFHSYLGRRYALPLDATDTVLMEFSKPIVLDLSIAALYPRADMIPTNLQNRINEHVKRLTDIRDGNQDLPSSAPPPPSPVPTSGIKFSARPRAMGDMP